MLSLLCRSWTCRFFTTVHCPPPPSSPPPPPSNRHRSHHAAQSGNCSADAPPLSLLNTLRSLHHTPSHRRDMTFFTTGRRLAVQASVLFLLLQLVATTSAQQCFYPDGTISPDTPCSTDSGHSACCGASSFCMDNGLCFGGGILSRGSCTDENWESDSCASYCKKGETELQHPVIIYLKAS